MTQTNSTLQRFGEVTVRLSVELGRSQLPLREVLSLAEGSVVTLDRLTDELLDVTANGRVVARGEVVAQDGRFALRVVSLVDETSADAGRSRSNAVPMPTSVTPPSPAGAEPAPVPPELAPEPDSEPQADQSDATRAEDTAPLPEDTAEQATGA